MGKGRPPQFNRFAYWEKLDYWAMLVGMHTMGLTGLELWFPFFFSGCLPGYFINLARILHLYEALLAVALKFVVHLVTAHLRPEVYPLDKSIFDGKTTLERMQAAFKEQQTRFEAGLATSSEQQRPELIAARQRELAQGQAALDAATQARLNWPMLVPRSDKNLEAIAKKIPPALSMLCLRLRILKSIPGSTPI